MKEVKKVWGKEIWIVNCKEYCSKLLYLDKGAESSTHYHKAKQETFYVLEGQISLLVEDKFHILVAMKSEPVTIMPREIHKFRGVLDSVILEISTHHDDEDVVRLTESKGGK